MTRPPAAAARPRWLLPLVIGLAGVIVLAVVGVLVWTFLRPVLPGDYSKVSSGAQKLIDDYQIEVVFQVTQVANDDGSDPAHTQGKVDLLQDTMDDYHLRIIALAGERAFNDESLEQLYQPVRNETQGFITYIELWGASVPPVKHMQRVCADFDTATGYLSSHATAEDFDGAAADCIAAVEQAADVEVQSAVVHARADYLVERRAAWEINGQARAGGTIDRTKSQEAMRLDAQATRDWQEAEQAAVAEVADDLAIRLAMVPEALEQFRAAIPTS